MLWYKGLTVMIKRNEKISEEISVFKGTRQGDLSSPFLFNALYQDMIESLDDTQRGIRIGSHSYNVFCYADDVLLPSLTVSGLQRLIDTANLYICTHGLRFNPEKSVCITFSKGHVPERQWDIQGNVLKQVYEIVHLGVTFVTRPLCAC